MKYLSGVRGRFSKRDFPVFTINDIRMLLNGSGVSDEYVHLMVHNLMRRSEIVRITKAVYTFHKDEAVVGFAFYPFYYGFENALNIMGISGQGTNMIVVTPKNVRQGVRTFVNRNFRVKRIRGSMFFGYKTVEYDGFWVPVSDLEKTVIDMLYFQGGIRDELWPGILERLDRKRIREYLKRYDAKFGKKVLDEIRARSS